MSLENMLAYVAQQNSLIQVSSSILEQDGQVFLSLLLMM
jgi:hypothetical protein